MEFLEKAGDSMKRWGNLEIHCLISSSFCVLQGFSQKRSAGCLITVKGRIFFSAKNHSAHGSCSPVPKMLLVCVAWLLPECGRFPTQYWLRSRCHPWRPPAEVPREDSTGQIFALRIYAAEGSKFAAIRPFRLQGCFGLLHRRRLGTCDVISDRVSQH